MFSHCQLAIYNTFRVSALICHIEIYLRVKGTPPNRFSVFFSGICVLYHEGNDTLVHEHVHRVSSAVFGLQFACT